MGPQRGGRVVPSWWRRRWFRMTGVVLVLLGLALLGSSIAYFVYGFRARSDLEKLTLIPAGSPVSTEPPATGGSVALPGGFRPIAPEEAPPVGSLPPATRIRIPAIDLDSKVEELALVDLGDSRAYETPKHVVGHIPESANAGEMGTAWFFGHLETPFRGEGSVFRDLPRIPELLKQGEEVYAILDSSEASFLYKLVNPPEVLAEDALRLYDTGEPTIRLVTCVPRLVYDRRLVIWGELVGVKRDSLNP